MVKQGDIHWSTRDVSTHRQSSAEGTAKWYKWHCWFRNWMSYGARIQPPVLFRHWLYTPFVYPPHTFPPDSIPSHSAPPSHVSPTFISTPLSSVRISHPIPSHPIPSLFHNPGQLTTHSHPPSSHSFNLAHASSIVHQSRLLLSHPQILPIKTAIYHQISLFHPHSISPSHHCTDTPSNPWTLEALNPWTLEPSQILNPKTLAA